MINFSLDSLDSSIDPCHDFYTFSCGGWIQSHPTAIDKSIITVFTILREENARQLHQILQSPCVIDPNTPSNETHIDRQLFDSVVVYYNSCLNTSRIEENGVEPLITILREFHLDQLASGQIQLGRITAHLHSYQIPAFFQLYPSIDAENPEVYVMTLAQSGIYLPKVYYNDSSIMQYYTHIVEKVFNIVVPLLMDANVFISGDLGAFAKAVVDFESEIAGLTRKKEDTGDPILKHNKYLIADLRDLAQFINWDVYLEYLYPSSIYTDKVGLDKKLIIHVPSFLTSLSNLVARTDPSVIQYYLIWTVIAHFQNALPNQLALLLNQLGQKTGTKSKVEPDRAIICADRLNKAMGEAFAKWFLKQTYSASSKRGSEALVEYLKKSFIESFPRLEWLDEITRRHALAKIDKLSVRIGYADYLLTPSKVFKVYGSAAYSQNYLDNIKVNLRMMDAAGRKQILSVVDREEWSMTPFEVNAYYAMNEIAFPAGILQPPFYSASNPQSLNYGAIGVVIGHEFSHEKLSHAFDSNGRKFNGKGELQDWWTNTTTTEFQHRKQCFVDQFSEYTVDIGNATYNVNGLLTVNENIADSGGVSRAWDAWKLGPQKEIKLPGLDYTPSQLFFIGYAMMWCSNQDDEVLIRHIRNNVHSPNRFRVLGALGNSREFGDAFGCNAGSIMNPITKCKVW